MDINSLQKLFTRLTDNRDKKLFAWLRYILLMASGLFGILISLHNSGTESSAPRLLFSLAILTLGLGILSGSIALYLEVFVARRLFRLFQKRIQERTHLEDPLGNIVLKKQRFFLVVEVVCYVCLCSSVLLLSVYTFIR